MAACGAVPGFGKRQREGKEGRGKTKKASIATSWALLGRGTIAGFLNGLHAEIHPDDGITALYRRFFKRIIRGLGESRGRTAACNAMRAMGQRKQNGRRRKPRGDGGRSRQGQTGSGEEEGKEERSKGKA